MKRLLIVCFGLLACGTTALAHEQGSLSAEVRCPGVELFVTAHQHGSELRDLGSGILEFSGPSHIPDVTWSWNADDPNQVDQVLAAFGLPEGTTPGTYTAWLEDHSQPYQTTFEVVACSSPSPTPTATPTSTPTPTETPTGAVSGEIATPVPPAGGVAGAALPNTGTPVPFGLGFGLIGLGLVTLAGAAWLMGRRSA